jgi:hypothetical protein
MGFHNVPNAAGKIGEPSEWNLDPRSRAVSRQRTPPPWSNAGGAAGDGPEVRSRNSHRLSLTGLLSCWLLIRIGKARLIGGTLDAFFAAA